MNEREKKVIGSLASEKERANMDEDTILAITASYLAGKAAGLRERSGND